MPYRPEHKQNSRDKILTSAAKLFSHQGYDKVTIDDVMADASLTRGAFYAHFKNKSELYAQAVLTAARRSPILTLKPADQSPETWLSELSTAYLSRAHINDVDLPCPLAFLASDVAIRDSEVRNAYTNVFRRLTGRLKRIFRRGRETEETGRELALAALLIGGVAVGRALDDEELRERLLADCRELAGVLIRGG